MMALPFYSRFRLELPLLELLFSMHALLWDTSKCPCHHMQTWYSASCHPHIVSSSSQYFTPKSYTNAHGQRNKAILIFLRLLQTTYKLGRWSGSRSEHLSIKSSNFSGQVFGGSSGLSLVGADILSFNLLQGSGKGLDALERICEHTSTKL